MRSNFWLCSKLSQFFLSQRFNGTFSDNIFKNIQNKSESRIVKIVKIVTFSNKGVLSLWRFSFGISITVLEINSMESLTVSQVLLFQPGLSFLVPYWISVRAGGDHIFQHYNQAPAVLQIQF